MTDINIAASNKIESQDLSIASVYNDFYYVPDYQREYVWGDAKAKNSVDSNEVEQFLNDIYSEFSTSPDSEYFIGTFLVCKNPEQDAFELVDGQQRLTTSFVILCALRDILDNYEEDAPDDLKRMIFTSKTGKDRVTRKLAKLTLQYKDSAGILDTVVQADEELSSLELQTRSATNIRNAYFIATNFLNENCSNRIELIDFFLYFTQQVKIIRVMTPTLEKALQIFETINDRGVGLDAMDLLKNLMFMKANKTQYENLRDKWEDLTKTLHKSREKPMRFLRYFVLANYAKDNRLRENEIYKWFQSNAALTGHNENPMAFVEELVGAARNYANFKAGKDTRGIDQDPLQNLAILGGASMRQHFILLLGAKSLSDDHFLIFAKFVERLMFAWYMTDAVTRDTEPKIVKICKELRNEDFDENEFDVFIERLEKEHLEGLSKGFSQAVMNLDQTQVQKYRLKYILAKLTQFVEQEAKGVTESNRWLRHFTSKDFEIEHILATGAKPEAISEFFGDDDHELSEYVPMLGNLLLLDKTRNIIASNDPYSTKIAAYNETDTVLSQYIARKPPIGKNDRISRAHEKHLKVFKKWNPKKMEKRQKMLTRLAHIVWDIPKPNDLPRWDDEAAE